MDNMKLICKGTTRDVVRWLLDNRPDIFDGLFGRGTYTAVIEGDKGDIQRGVWNSEQEMQEELARRNVQG